MITILSGMRGDTRRYRTLHPYEQLRLYQTDCLISHLTDPRLDEKLRAADIVILHRVAYDGYVARLMDALQARGALVIMDADDFLYDPEIMRWIDSPDFQDPVRARLYRQELLRHQATLKRCDAVTVSTGSLGKMMEPFGLPVRVHRNAFSLEMLALSDRAVQNRARPGERVVIGYASGTRTHDRDFALIQPALCEVMGRHPQAELWLMGHIEAGEGWGSLRERVKTFAPVPWRALPERLALLDINLAPLVAESPFNQAKSEIKYMEAGLVSVPTIASPTDAFTHAIHHGQNGLLANNLAEWQAHLERLIDDAPAREAMGAAAYRHVVEHYAPQIRGAELMGIFVDFSRQTGKGQAAVNLPAAEGVPEKVSQAERTHLSFSQHDEEHPTLGDMALYSLRHRGAGLLLGQVWVFIRRKLAPIFPFQRAKTE